MSAETDVLEIGFAAWLSGLDDFTDLAGAGKVYPVVNTEPGERDFPYAVYRRLGTSRQRKLRGGAGLPTATLEVVFWGRPSIAGYGQAKLLANAVRPHVEGWSDQTDAGLKWGEVTVTSCWLDDESDVVEVQEGHPEALAFGVRFVLSVTWRESVLTLPRTE